MPQIKFQEVFDPHLKVSKYQWGEKEGVDKMKSMTPGEGVKKKKMAEQKIPYLFMNSEQKSKLNEQNMQLEFDGIQTKNLDMCLGAYKAFKSMIADIRANKLLGEPAGHEKSISLQKGQPELSVEPTPRGGSDVVRKVEAGIAMKPKLLKHMQFKQYTGL